MSTIIYKAIKNRQVCFLLPYLSLPLYDLCTIAFVWQNVCLKPLFVELKFKTKILCQNVK